MRNTIKLTSAGNKSPALIGRIKNNVPEVKTP